MKAIFITVRTGSTRFPAKCLKWVGNKRAIELVIDRVKRSKRAQQIVLCTTWLPDDDILCSIARENGIEFRRGSTEDKLMRWKGATIQHDVDFFVTADGDDLLCDPELIDLAFGQYDRNGSDFIEAPNVPCGAFTYGISTAALKRVCEIKDTDDTEMMVPYFREIGKFGSPRAGYKNPFVWKPMFRFEQLENVPSVLQRPEIRMTLDYPDDLKFFDNIYSNFDDTSFTLRDVIAYLDANPEVIDINKYLQEKYLANQKLMTRMVLK